MPYIPAPGPFTVSVISHGQGTLCANLIADLARCASGSIGKLVLTQNIPQTLPRINGLPFVVEIIDNCRPKGFGANHNQAYTRCHSEYFAVVNPDLRLRDDPFPALARCLQDPRVGIAAPLVRDTGGSIADFARPLVSPWQVLRRRIGGMALTANLAKPDWIAGIFLAFRREAYGQLGGFDTQYFLYCEDVDICARARLRGLQLCMAQDTFVIHLAQRDSRRSLRFMGMHVSSLLRFWSSPVYREFRALLRAETIAAESAE